MLRPQYQSSPALSSKRPAVHRGCPCDLSRRAVGANPGDGIGGPKDWVCVQARSRGAFVRAYTTQGEGLSYFLNNGGRGGLPQNRPTNLG